MTATPIRQTAIKTEYRISNRLHGTWRLTHLLFFASKEHATICCGASQPAAKTKRQAAYSTQQLHDYMLQVRWPQKEETITTKTETSTSNGKHLVAFALRVITPLSPTDTHDPLTNSPHAKNKFRSYRRIPKQQAKTSVLQLQRGAAAASSLAFCCWMSWNRNATLLVSLMNFSAHTLMHFVSPSSNRLLRKLWGNENAQPK